jgi:cold shock protein
MKKAIVKWFDDERGYGILAAIDGQNDIFVRRSIIQATGRKTLNGGQQVEFAAETTAKGPCATTVIPR